MLMKPKKLRKIIREEIGVFSSKWFYGLFILVFGNSWYFYTYTGTMPFEKLFPFLTFLILAGEFAKIKFTRWDK